MEILVTLSLDRKIKLWKAPNFNQVMKASIKGSPTAVEIMSINDKISKIIVSDWDGIITIWNI